MAVAKGLVGMVLATIEERSGRCPIRFVPGFRKTRPMTTPVGTSSRLEQPVVPRFSVAGTFLEGLAARDFDRLATALCDDVHLRALLPPGVVTWDGAEGVKGAFTKWFGDLERYELVDAVVGEVGPRLHLRWRVRVEGERLGQGWFVVEQQAYGDTDDSGRIRHLSILCSGYCPERSND